jgi:hypothetical protein
MSAPAPNLSDDWGTSAHSTRWVWNDGGVLDDATRRQLRFSLFLQGFAALMMSVALVVRATSVGWDTVTIVLAVAVAIILGAAFWTFSHLRAG